MAHTVLGSIVSLWRYPVKSMLGEELNATEITKGGLLGDRVYALVDSSDGKVASAKNPRKWPQLFDCRAALAEDLLHVIPAKYWRTKRDSCHESGRDQCSSAHCCRYEWQSKSAIGRVAGSQPLGDMRVPQPSISSLRVSGSVLTDHEVKKLYLQTLRRKKCAGPCCRFPARASHASTKKASCAASASSSRRSSDNCGTALRGNSSDLAPPIESPRRYKRSS